MNGIVSGLGAGTLAGGSIGLAWERLTHVPKQPAKPAGFDEWQRRFETHFAEEIATDSARNDQLDNAIEGWTNSDPPPSGMDLTRSDEGWSVAPREPKERDSIGPLLIVGAIGGIASLTPMMFVMERGVDQLRYAGWRGMIVGGPPALVAATLGAYFTSDATH